MRISLQCTQLPFLIRLIVKATNKYLRIKLLITVETAFKLVVEMQISAVWLRKSGNGKTPSEDEGLYSKQDTCNPFPHIQQSQPN